MYRAIAGHGDPAAGRPEGDDRGGDTSLPYARIIITFYDRVHSLSLPGLVVHTFPLTRHELVTRARAYLRQTRLPGLSNGTHIGSPETLSLTSSFAIVNLFTSISRISRLIATSR